MPEDFPVMPDPTVLRSTISTSVTPRWARAHAAAAPSMPPPTMTTSAVSLTLALRGSWIPPNVNPVRTFARSFALASRWAPRRAHGSPGSRNPVGARQGDPSHRGRLDGHGHQILGLEVPDVGLAARPGDGLRLHRQHPQVVGQPSATLHCVEAGGQLGILGADSRWVGTVLEVVEETGGATECFVLCGVARVVVAERDQRRGPDRYRVSAECHRLGDVGTVAYAAGDDQLDLPSTTAVHAEFGQRPHPLRARRQRGDADVLDEHLLRCGGATLHAVDDDDVGARVDGEFHVVVRAGGADLDVDRLFPVGDP